MYTQHVISLKEHVTYNCGWGGGLIIRSLNTGSSGLDLSLGHRHCAVLFGRTLNTVMVPPSTHGVTTTGKFNTGGYSCNIGCLF